MNVIPNIEGEDYDEIYDRAKLFWKSLFLNLKRNSEIKNVLIVTHAATKIALGSALLQLNQLRCYR